MGGGTIVLDTTVLVARPIHQLLGTLGVDGFFDVVWSEDLLAELVDVLERPPGRDGRGWPTSAAQAVAGYIRAGFPAGEVAAGEVLDRLRTASEFVTDPGDAHIAALALAAGAEMLVTANTTDYCRPKLKAAGIQVITPDALLVKLYVAFPDEVAAAVERQVAERTRYPTSTHHILSLLCRAGCPTFAARMCDDLGLPSPDAHRHVVGRNTEER